MDNQTVADIPEMYNYVVIQFVDDPNYKTFRLIKPSADIQECFHNLFGESRIGVGGYASMFPIQVMLPHKDTVYFINHDHVKHLYFIKD